MIKFSKKINEVVCKLSSNRSFILFLFILSIFVLIITSVYVGYKSSNVHFFNHDQVVEAYLFENKNTFKDALFPTNHTQLIKWPLFLLIATFGNTKTALAIATILMYLSIAIGIAILIYLASNKNKLISSVIILGLSNILLLTPIQPILGVLLPVNMAMITTRNVEFLPFFVLLYFLSTTQKLTSLLGLYSVIILILLGASDKIFLYLILLSAISLLLIERYFYRKKQLNFTPLLISVISFVCAPLLLSIINALKITGIPTTTSLSPYAFVSSIKMLFAGIAGAIQGTFINFGINIFGKPLTPTIMLVNGINLGLLLFSFIAIFKFCKILFNEKSSKEFHSVRFKFITWLVLCATTSVLIFIISDHDYLVDARYIIFVLFAGIITLAYMIEKYKLLSSTTLVIIYIFIILIIPLSTYKFKLEANTSLIATKNNFGNNQLEASKILLDSGVKVLVGDYWFSSPIRNITDNRVTVVQMSINTCDVPNSYLTSTAWRIPSENVEKSALYVMRDSPGAQTFNHGCTLQQLKQKYGVNPVTKILEGTENNPSSFIWIYNYDIRTKL